VAGKLAIYITDTELRLMRTDGNKVDKWGIVPLDEGVVVDGVVHDEKALAERLRDSLNQNLIKEKRALVAASSLGSSFRLLTLPPELPSSLIGDAVLSEAKRSFPMNLDETYFSYQLLPRRGKEKLQAFAVACPRALVDGIYRSLAKAGIKIKALDLAPLALERLVDRERFVLISLDSGVLDIAIVINRIPDIIRTYAIPAEVTSSGGGVTTAFEELRRTISFFNTNNPSDPITTETPMFVFGELAELAPQNNFFVAEAGVPVNLVPFPLEAPEDFPSGRFAVGAGLLLKGSKKDRVVDINVLPERYREPSFSWTRVAVPVAVVLALAVIAFGVYEIRQLDESMEPLYDQQASLELQIAQARATQADLIAQRDRLSATLPEGEATIASVEKQLADLDGLIAQAEAALNEPIPAKDEIAALEEELAGLQNTLSMVNEGLDTLMDLKPAAVTISKLSYNEGTITLRATAPTQGEVLGYVTALRESEVYLEVTLSALSIVENGVAFELTLSLSG